MKLFICISLLIAALSPSLNEKPELPPANASKEEIKIVKFSLEKILFIKISGQGEIADTREAVKKVGIEHKVDNIMLYSEDMIPVLMPKSEYEKYKDNDNLINVHEMLEKAKKSVKEKEEKAKAKEPEDRET